MSALMFAVSCLSAKSTSINSPGKFKCQEAEAIVGQRHKLSGLLRINCPVCFGDLQIVPRIKAFLQRYPDIKLDLMMNDGFEVIIYLYQDLRDCHKSGMVRDTDCLIIGFRISQCTSTLQQNVPLAAIPMYKKYFKVII
ncbi:MAG: LysR substrate-binding domain-containing protein [Cyanobacteria bacterium P01_D01_bin.50]